MPTLGSNGDADIEERLMDTGVGTEGEGGMDGENSMEAYTLPYVKQIESENLLCDTGNSTQLSDNPEGWDGLRDGRGFSSGRGYMYTCD